MTFDEWSRAVMDDKDISQAELARRTGASTGLVSLWYWGKKTPSTRYVAKIARALGRTDQQIFSALAGREASPAANLDVQTRTAITRLFGLPPDFSEGEAELIRDLVHTLRRWQERMREKESVQAEMDRGPRRLETEDDRQASGA
jgi:transcriptional regulator with XRE-family HTH domain